MSTSSRRDQLLVETDWLASHLSDPQLRIVDIRGTVLPVTAPPPWYAANREAYFTSHIPGAVFVDWLQDIMDPDAPVKATAASPAAFAQVMERLGIGNQHKIVVYDDDGCHIAARLWWMLRYYGHDNVVLLNGGWPKWVAEGRPVTSEVPQYPRTTFAARPQPGWRADMEEVRQAMSAPDVLLFDNRGPAMYRGEATRGQRKGHIPGAVNVPITTLVEGPHQTWRSDDVLHQIFDDAGLQPQKQVITYCNAGVSASVGLFALHLLGHTQATNYDGSWYEWEQDPNNPVIIEDKTT